MLAALLGTLLAMLVVVGIGGPKPRPAHAEASSPIALTDQWTPTTQVWQDPTTGEITATIGSGPIQAPDESSSTGWSTISTDLQSSPDGLSPESTPADITLSDGTDDSAPVATVAQDGQSLSVDPTGDVPAPTVDGTRRPMLR